MDSKQAAETLRTVAVAIPQFTDIDIPMADVAETVRKGADAVLMLEWLMEESGGIPRTVFLHRAWLICRTADETFRAYCESRFREHKNANHQGS